MKNLNTRTLKKTRIHLMLTVLVIMFISENILGYKVERRLSKDEVVKLSKDKHLEQKTRKLKESTSKLEELKKQIEDGEHQIADKLSKHKEIIRRLEKENSNSDKYLEGKFYGMPIYSDDFTFFPDELKNTFKKQNKNFERQLLEKRKKGVVLNNVGHQKGRDLEETQTTDEYGDDAMMQHRFSGIDENYKEEVNKVLENIHSSIKNMNEEKHIMKGMMENQLDRKLDFLYYDFVRVSHRIDETQAYLVNLMSNIDKHFDDKEFRDMLDVNGNSNNLKESSAMDTK